jgi:DnaJ family protein A protein 2
MNTNSKKSMPVSCSGGFNTATIVIDLGPTHGDCSTICLMFFLTAYQMLSDSEKRAKYDKYGLEGLEDGAGGGGGGAEDLFSMFFGGGGGRRSAGPRRGEDVNHPLKVSLEQLYNGKTIKLAVARQVLVGETKICSTCDGKGVVTELRQIALGMVQQIQRHCPDCNGEGYEVNKKREREVLEVLIEKGMKNNQKIVFRNKADEKPNMEAGHLNFILEEKPHELFKRKGADLLVTKTLSLNEALCGFEWKINHLDGREIIIKSKSGEVIKPEKDNKTPFVKIVPGEGMPSHGNPFVKGDLYVLFTVEFPEDGDLKPDQIEVLKKILPGAAMAVEYDPETAEVAHLIQANVKNFGKGGVAGHDVAYDSDDDDGGAQPVQCQQS